MKYQLTGFAKLMSGTPTLLIPYFARRDTNLVFAQNIDDEFVIESFLAFNPDNHDVLPYYGEPIERSVADPAVLAVFWENGQITCGDAAALMPVFTKKDFDFLGARFFGVEAAIIAGDGRMLSRARDFASEQLGTQGAQWLADQARLDRRPAVVDGPKPRPPDPREQAFQETLERLRLGEYDSGIWPGVWLKAWSEFAGDERLAEIARWWLEQNIGNRDAQGIVILVLVRQHGWGVEFAEYVINWLEQSPPYPRPWPDIWARVTRSVGVPPSLEALGLRFLRTIIGEGEHEPKSRLVGLWCTIWNRLWRGTHTTGELIDIASEAAQSLRHHTHFVGEVLLSLARSELTGDWPLPMIRDWIVGSPNRSTRWARMYLELISEFKTDEEFVEAGRRWLFNGPPNLSIWPRVWQALRMFMEKEEWWRAASEWLARTSPVLKVWPDVLGDVLRHHGVSPRSRVGARAVEWIDLNREHQERDIIAAFADAHARAVLEEGS